MERNDGPPYRERPCKGAFATQHQETLNKVKTATETLRFSTRGHNDIHDLTPAMKDLLRRSGVKDGLATAFVPGSTAAITTLEFEDGAISDLKNAISRLAPENIPYEHNERWGDGNGFSHVRAALLGPSLSIPVVRGSLALGTWQQIVLVDCDNRDRTREIILQVMGTGAD